MIAVILGAMILALDQAFKFLAAAVLNGGSELYLSAPIIKNIFSLTYVENTGMAWGAFSNATGVLTVIRAIVTVLMLVFIIMQYKRMNTLMRYAVILICVGALGNLIDGLLYGYVRDMINLRLFDFPVFNIADASITIGTVLFVISAIFTKSGHAFIDRLLSSNDKKAADEVASDKAESADVVSENVKAADEVASDKAESTDVVSENVKAADEVASDKAESADVVSEAAKATDEAKAP